ncbi:hypothetical protein PGH45_20055 [Legionella pneumophila]|nr:hypothetical protein [Legionella pneumophila]
MRALISPDFNELSWPIINESDGFIAEAIPCPSTVIEIGDEAMEVSITDSQAQTVRTRLVNCEVSHYPAKPFALWQTPDLFANLLDTEQGSNVLFNFIHHSRYESGKDEGESTCSCQILKRE